MDPEFKSYDYTKSVSHMTMSHASSIKETPLTVESSVHQVGSEHTYASYQTTTNSTQYTDDTTSLNSIELKHQRARKRKNNNGKYFFLLICTVVVALVVGLGIGFFFANPPDGATPNGRHGSPNVARMGDEMEEFAGEGRAMFDECGKRGSAQQMRSSHKENETSARVRRIVGGHGTTIESYPWQASLWVDNHGCGGAIIAPNWILFTAHCAIEFPTTNAWTVYAGETKQSAMSAHAQQSRVTDMIMHTEFTTKTYNKDVALLRLSRPLRYSTTVQPICIPDVARDMEPGEVCDISGWGSRTEGAVKEESLRATEVTVIDRSVCNQPQWLAGLVNENMICAGTVDGSKDACQGDSGGPMTCYERSKGRYFLRGSVSWGIGCGVPRMPGVYTHIAKLNKWVRGVINAVEENYGQAKPGL